MRMRIFSLKITYPDTHSIHKTEMVIELPTIGRISFYHPTHVNVTTMVP